MRFPHGPLQLHKPDLNRDYPGLGLSSTRDVIARHITMSIVLFCNISPVVTDSYKNELFLFHKSLALETHSNEILFHLPLVLA